jgi:hypothetical protein
MEVAMARMFFVTIVAVAAFNSGPATADFYSEPWCAVIAMGDGDMQWDCEYRTIEECRPNVLAGNRGWCNPNPYLVASSAPERPKHSRKRHTQPQ